MADIFLPPITDNEAQNIYNEQVLAALDAGQVGVVSSLPNGSIISGNNVIAYRLRYVSVRYADGPDGAGFSTASTNKLYYGIFNADTTDQSENPADYSWYLTTGFGTNYQFWYRTTGGRQVQWRLDTQKPDDSWSEVPVSAIDLDFFLASTPSYNVLITVRTTTDTTTDPTTWAFEDDGTVYKNNFGPPKYLLATLFLGAAEQSFAAHNTYTYAWNRNGTSFTPSISGETTTRRWLAISPEDIEDSGSDQFICVINTP